MGTSLIASSERLLCPVMPDMTSPHSTVQQSADFLWKKNLFLVQMDEMTCLAHLSNNDRCRARGMVIVTGHASALVPRAPTARRYAPPEVTRVPVARVIDETILRWVVEDRRKGAVRVEQVRCHTSVIRLERGHSSREL
jgi:hypothetical protein